MITILMSFIVEVNKTKQIHAKQNKCDKMFLHLHIIDAATKMRFSKIMSWENTHKSK